MRVRTLQRLTSNLWATREARCLSIIERALTMLRESDDPPETEVDLNRRFYFCLLTAGRELYPDDVIAPITECNNQPVAEDEVGARREKKRPDFQWAYLDRYELDPHRSNKQFVVECKRLGKAQRRDWVFNRNYAENGIARFCDPEWAYAKQAPSGAMVGYWQSMEGEMVLQEVNEGCDHRSIPGLVFIGSECSMGISRFEQHLVRAFPISPFRLHHLWIDLR